MIIIDCDGQFIDQKTARFARSRFLDADHAAMHPTQWICIENIFPFRETSMPDPKVNHFMNMRLFLDVNMVKNEIHFRDFEGRLIAKITNLAVPSEDQQDCSPVRRASEGR